MRAIVIRQPWASLIASGKKTVELRSWRTTHRGPLLIVAGRQPWPGLAPDGPLGVSVCIVDVVDCRPATPHDADKAGAPPPDGWWAWHLANARHVTHVPIVGKLSFFNVPDF